MTATRILCLDDEVVGLAVRAAVLRYAGYNVFTASVAEEALQILADEHIDLVISDHMLQGTTGTQVAVSMKRIRPDIPILILSGFTEAPEGMEFADFFLSKLEPPPVLLATVDNLLTQRRSLLTAQS
jgi:CheY-like chemotaxis protein